MRSKVWHHKLGARESRELIHGIAISTENPPEESFEAVSQAWNVEIARRVAVMKSADVSWLAEEEVFERLGALIEHSR
jgi:hypothetical protein